MTMTRKEAIEWAKKLANENNKAYCVGISIQKKAENFTQLLQDNWDIAEFNEADQLLYYNTIIKVGGNGVLKS
jgi:hypothetical protein